MYRSKYLLIMMYLIEANVYPFIFRKIFAFYHTNLRAYFPNSSWLEKYFFISVLKDYLDENALSHKVRSLGNVANKVLWIGKNFRYLELASLLCCFNLIQKQPPEVFRKKKRS